MAATSARSFDYIIVRAGSAGCVLADRLSEKSGTAVLLLEAGGSTAINGMVYARGHRRDYDDWAQKGLKGWSYADVLPYFRRSENSWLGDNAYHGTGGPMDVVSPKENQMYAELKAAAVAAGIPATDDYHGERSEGIQRAELTINQGLRGNTARLYLDPAMARPNLSVISRAHTTRVLFDGRRAAGVEYLQDGQLHSVRAAREVILSGGTYGSAQTLMLSGIGPADALKRHGITPLVDLPGVGKNLIEHPFLFLGWHAQPGTFNDKLRVDRATLLVLRWMFFRSGTFSTNGTGANMFVRTLPHLDRPDMQYTCVSVELSASDVWFPGFRRPEHMLRCGLSMIREDSRGEVTLRSADPRDPPRILFNLFKERSDVERMIRGVRLAREIYNQAPLKQFTAGEIVPGERVQSDEEIEAFVRAEGAITQHPVGTCKMGIESDPDAVVDDHLRVRGAEGLRVIDASVMPNVPGGNTNAPAIMIGEKGADLIRGRSLPRAELQEAG